MPLDPARHFDFSCPLASNLVAEREEISKGRSSGADCAGDLRRLLRGYQLSTINNQLSA
jgi:hypothetical protein